MAALEQLSDADVADALDRVGDLLEAQDADPFRVRAWRRAAETLRTAPEPVAKIVARNGRDGLLALHGIGQSMASAIEELLATGRLRTLERLEGRFNPTGEAWLPVLHSERDGWSLTALYSNTARAHALGTTRDWVIVYYDRDGDEGQCTVVTEHAGARAGRRVVRGREDECAQLDESRGPAASARAASSATC